MHDRFIVESLVAQRAAVTGESTRRLTPAMTSLVEELSQVDRQALWRPRDIVNGDLWDSDLAHDLRQRILPAAVRPEQRELEAAVFHALLRAMGYLERHPSAWCYRLGRVVTRVEPGPEEIRLWVDDVILGPLLSELLPVDATDNGQAEVHGTVGLRARWHGGEVELCLIDTALRARVLLYGIGRGAWNAAQVFLAAENPIALWLCTTFPDALSSLENEALRYHPRIYSPVQFASGLLRRIRIFKDVWWIKATAKGMHQMVVEWPEGPAQRDVLAVLCHPTTAIVANRFIASVWPSIDHAQIDDLDPPASAERINGADQDRLLLRALSSDYVGYLSSRTSTWNSTPWWRAWEREYRNHSPRSAAGQLLLDELVALRCSYTGELPEPAEKCVRPLVERLRSAVPSRTSHGLDFRSMDVDDVARLRAGLVPQAHSVDQRILETSLLLAIHHSGPAVSEGPYRGHRVFRAVSPRLNHLVVDMIDTAVARFFRALLAPLHPSEGRDGVPGLRLQPGPEHLRVRLLNEDSVLTDASVTIRGIGRDPWTKIWQDIRGSVWGGQCVNPLYEKSPRLSPGEQYGIGFQRQECGPVALGSAMLRRMGLIAGAFGLDAWSGLGNTEIHVEIDRGPSVRSVTAALNHPIGGLATDGVVLGSVDEGFARFEDTNPTPARFAGSTSTLTGRPALVLRALKLPDDGELSVHPKTDAVSTQEEE